MHNFEPESYFLLDPHIDTYSADTKLIPIDAIATKAYGKPFNSLRACQRDHENACNDMVIEYGLADDDTYAYWLEQFDENKVVLGYDNRSGKATVVKGVNELAYWQSITWLDGDSTIETVSPEEVAMYENMANSGSPMNDYIQNIWTRYQNGELTVVEVNPPDTKDLTNAVFAEEFYAQRAFSPSLGQVLADLIRKDELPRGNFLYHHWW